MRVIGAGLGRTGTLSLKVALERLGFGPCYHMQEVLAQPERAGQWLAALDSDKPDWDAVLDGYRSTVDWPGAAFWRELVAAYPDAKVILTVRDPQRWYDSMANTIFPAADSVPQPGSVLLRILTAVRPAVGGFLEMNRRLVAERAFGGGRLDDRDHVVAAFERHNAEVRAEVPADRLLVFEVSQGWAPLCEFLGVPVPDEPFPRLNDTAEFNRRRTERMRSLARTAAVAGAATVAVAAAVAVALRYRRRS